MTPVFLEQIAEAVCGTTRNLPAGCLIERVCTDSRGVSPHALFVALKGDRTDGHRFLADAFRNGAACAIVAQDVVDQSGADPSWPLIIVESPLRALQLLAKWYRAQFMNRVIAVTGSRGKTMVKQALGALLARIGVTTSPGSYNSQLGVPLAVLANEKEAALSVLEAGVSEPGEMAVLEEIAAPDFGILTNIGVAHLASFGSREAIAREKMALFRRIPAEGWVLLPDNEATIRPLAATLSCRIHWIGAPGQPLALGILAAVDGGQRLALTTADGARREVTVATRSPDIIADLHIAATAALLLGVSLDDIVSTLDGYAPRPTRTEVWSSSQGVRIVNDAHTTDPMSVHAALRSAALGASHTGRKFFALAGARELGPDGGAEQRQVGAYAADCGYSHLFLVGDVPAQTVVDGFRAQVPDGVVTTVRDPSELKEHLLPLLRWGDTVLFKGPPMSGMSLAARDLAGSIAPRAEWVDLAAIGENVARFRRHCGGGVRVMAVLKALAYGTESDRLAFWLSRLGIHHIGVSTPGEGVAVRRTGIGQEIYVFMPGPADIDNILRYRLIPVLYDAVLVEQFEAALADRGAVIDVHMKVNTGMNRLGVEPGDALTVARRIRASGTMRLAGLCTHFASADDPDEDAFTRRQIATFDQVIAALKADGFDDLLIHAANTAGAARFPEAHYDMVRVGLGLYGIYPSPAVEQALELVLAVGVTSQVTRIQHVRRGESLGYNRPFSAQGDLKVGIVPFGYDDGLRWQHAATGAVMINGRMAPIVGRVSMDQMQVDVTDVPGVGPGTPVLLYGAHDGYAIRPETAAQAWGTIPHEMLVKLGNRVTRIYIEP
ncbi:MAG: alanine racemase [Acetobacteraceae bacterium]